MGLKLLPFIVSYFPSGAFSSDVSKGNVKDFNTIHAFSLLGTGGFTDFPGHKILRVFFLLNCLKIYFFFYLFLPAKYFSIAYGNKKHWIEK